MNDYSLQLFTNNAVSLLAKDISSTDTTIIVQQGLGNLYPQPVNPGEWFLATLEDINSSSPVEIIKIIGRTGDILTVDNNGRGQEGTTPTAWAQDVTQKQDIAETKKPEPEISVSANKISLADINETAKTKEMFRKIFSE